MKNKGQLKFQVFEALNEEELKRLQERHYSNSENHEFYPWAKGIDLVDIASSIVPDKSGSWKSPIVCIISKHAVTLGTKTILRETAQYFENQRQAGSFDILSICAEIKGETIFLKTLLRLYKSAPNINGLFKALGDSIYEETVTSQDWISGQLIEPPEAKNFKLSEDDIKKHELAYNKQMEIYEASDEDVPFLNRIDRYVSKTLVKPEDVLPYIYDVESKDRQIHTVTSYKTFKQVFSKIMTYVSGVEYYHYAQVLSDGDDPSEFMKFIKAYIKTDFINTGMLAEEDLSIMLERVYNALFKLYIVQDLIDDPDITDVNITAYDVLRVTIRGKTYLSNISFVDKNDFIRFLNSLCLRNNIPQNVPYIRFVDECDERYRLRFTISSEYITAEDTPYIHIRKIPKQKMLADELMAAGMFDEKIRDYIIDRGRHGSVIFAGAPGSGKTYTLNWFLEEAYEETSRILVLQEADELFAYRKGVMFQHLVLNPPKGSPAISLEELGQNALVAGANTFIIGETKGAEICSMITLAASGCRTATTIHSDSAKEVIDKMVDLAMRGDTKSPKQVKRMLKCFDTIVYLSNFKVEEIAEINGFDDDSGELIVKNVYKRILD